MNAKMIEIRDRGTFIPALAIQLSPSCEADRFLLARAGFGVGQEDQARYIVLCRIAGGGMNTSTTDPYDWGSSPRTFHVAHKYIVQHWSELESGAVVDVEFALGESAAPKRSELWERLGDSVKTEVESDLERDRR